MLLHTLKQSLLSSFLIVYLISSSSILLAQEKAGKKYAVLVGVEQYQHSNLNQLNYAVDDMTDLAQILRESGYEVTLITDDAGKVSKALAPTRKNIENKIQSTLRQCKRNDTIMLAFAGHGMQFTGQKDAFFCPVDARPFSDETQSLISISKVYSEFKKSFAGVKVILIDACRNDPDSSRGTGGLNADAAPSPPRGVGALFSCSAGQRAFEHDDLKHGIFFHYVLEGLRNKAKDKRGEVTFDGLALYVRKNVPSRVRQLFPDRKYDQFPNLKADLIGVPPVLIPPSLTSRPSLLLAPFNKQVAESKQHAWARHLKTDVIKTNSIGMQLTLIPAGEFKMGSLESDSNRSDQGPQHRVQITKPFYLATTEVTQGQWKAVMENTSERKSKISKIGTNYPETSRNWDDAQEFINILNRKEGAKYRLPTEAEWEYACRAGSESSFFFGESPTILKEYAWFDENSEKHAHRVGAKKPNNFGLYDMHGNVLEWCQDRYGSEFYTISPVVDPIGPSSGEVRVLRGGCWFYKLDASKSAYRLGIFKPSIRFPYVGFRVVREID